MLLLARRDKRKSVGEVRQLYMYLVSVESESSGLKIYSYVKEMV